jgi:hypothetical protein
LTGHFVDWFVARIHSSIGLTGSLLATLDADFIDKAVVEVTGSSCGGETFFYVSFVLRGTTNLSTVELVEEGASAR